MGIDRVYKHEKREANLNIQEQVTNQQNIFAYGEYIWEVGVFGNTCEMMMESNYKGLARKRQQSYLNLGVVISLELKRLLREKATEEEDLFVE
jgi:hypothetical protein